MMESNKMNRVENKSIDPIHELAKKHELMIKGTVAKKFEVESDELALLLDDEAGVYMSREEENTMCTFVLGTVNGHMYVVTAKIEDDGKSLNDFKSDIVS